MLQPSALVLYVENITKTSQFYEDLLGIKPEESSPAFNYFTLNNGMGLGLKAKHTVQPAANESGGSEIVFTLNDKDEVDALLKAWQLKGIAIAQEPSAMTYGYTFVALDPDGNRLRVVALH